MRDYIFKKSSYVLFPFLFFAISITAQTKNSFNENSGMIKLPVLSKHRFIVNPYVGSPFIKTYFRNGLGYGVATDLNVPIIIIEGEPLAGLRGDLSFLTIQFEYQYAVNNWLAIFGKVGMLSKFGTEAQALVAQGINATYGFELGWMCKLFQTEKVMLSATANFWNQSGAILNLYDFIQNIIDNSGLDSDNKLIFSKDYIQGGGGLRVAWAVSENIGFNGLSEFAFGESLDNKWTKIFYNIAGSIDYDLKKDTTVPIGFALGMSINTFASSSDSSIDSKSANIFFRISYTGRDDILISIDMTWNKIPISNPSQTLNGMTSSLGLDYYF